MLFPKDLWIQRVLIFSKSENRPTKIFWSISFKFSLWKEVAQNKFDCTGMTWSQSGLDPSLQPNPLCDTPSVTELCASCRVTAVILGMSFAVACCWGNMLHTSLPKSESTHTHTHTLVVSMWHFHISSSLHVSVCYIVIVFLEDSTHFAEQKSLWTLNWAKQEIIFQFFKL